MMAHSRSGPTPQADLKCWTRAPMLLGSRLWRAFLLVLLCSAVKTRCGNITHDYNLMASRLSWLEARATKSVLVHVHIPKAGGTALSTALSTECRCSKNASQQPSCFNCKVVHGDDIRVPYSISRNTGWRLGVHPALAVMRYALATPSMNMTRHGLTPVFITMLRKPFERFLSEATQWMSRPGQTVDWSIANEANGKRYTLRGMDPLALTNGSTKTEVEQNTRLYAGLSGHFIFHNRQAKMLGGSAYDFDMYFDPLDDLGSRWRHRKAEFTTRAAERANAALRRQRDVLFVVHARFGEFICLLEILYGRLYRFNWDADVHSHNPNKRYQAGSSTSITATTRSNSTDAGSKALVEIYDLWARNNAEDERLYAAAERLFDVQFRAGLDLLRRRMAAEGKHAATKRTPHCKPFLS